MEGDPRPYLATGVGGGDDDRTTANCGSAAAPDELLTSSRISSLPLLGELGKRIPGPRRAERIHGGPTRSLIRSHAVSFTGRLTQSPKLHGPDMGPTSRAYSESLGLFGARILRYSPLGSSTRILFFFSSLPALVRDTDPLRSTDSSERTGPVRRDRKSVV